jgi:hypothetical protein
MQAQDRDVRIIGRGEASFGEDSLETLTGEAGPQKLLRLPHADEIQRVVTYSAMMTQLSRRSASLHDHFVRPVISASQFFDVPAESGDQECWHLRLRLWQSDSLESRQVHRLEPPSGCRQKPPSPFGAGGGAQPTIGEQSSAAAALAGKATGGNQRLTAATPYDFFATYDRA